MKRVTNKKLNEILNLFSKNISWNNLKSIYNDGLHSIISFGKFDFNKGKKLLLEEYKLGDGELDNSEDWKDEAAGFIRTNTPVIYAFITKYVPDYIKIGFTVQGAEARLSLWQKEYKDAKLLGFWTTTEFNDIGEKVYFMDFPVHERTNKRGFLLITDEAREEIKNLAKNSAEPIDMHVSKEFFRKYRDIDKDAREELSTEIIKDIITELKNNIKDNNIDFTLYKILYDEEGNEIINGKKVKDGIPWKESPKTYSETGLLELAIEKAIEAINNGKDDLLMAASMRFGKTHCVYEIIRRIGYKYCLVTSAKVDTKSAWRDDINHINYIDDFVFIEFEGNQKIVSYKDDKSNVIKTYYYQSDFKDIVESLMIDGKTLIIYASLQDLKGDKEGNIKDKHIYLYNHPVDMLVIDETHYGSHSAKYGKATGLNKEEYTIDEIRAERNNDRDVEELNNAVHKINAKTRLQCSGTPYYILASGEFGKQFENKTIISDVSYNDMLKAKQLWIDEHFDEDESNSPYFGIPTIIRYGMKLTRQCRRELINADYSTLMSKLFEIQNNKFVHEAAIIELMSALFGANNHKTPGFLDREKIKNGEIFKHIVCVLPRIDTCNVLKKLLIDKNIINEDERKIIVAVERREGGDALRKFDPEAESPSTLNSALNSLEKNNRKSITLTVNRFLTGVSVPLWDSMLYMKDTSSPQEYDLSIFRLCTRNIGTAIGSDGSKVKINRKSNVYLIDFKVDRMFNMVVQSAISQCAAKGNTNTNNVKEVIKLNILNMPIYSDDSMLKDLLGRLHEINIDDILKKYINYNNSKTIEDVVVDGIKQFGSFLNNLDNLQYLENFSDKATIGGAKTKLTDNEGSDELHVNNSGNSNRGNLNNNQPQTNDDTNELKVKIENKLKNMIKSILYSNICFETPCDDYKQFIDLLNNDEDARLIAENFNLYAEDLEEIYSKFNSNEKMNLNMMMYQIKQVMEDEEKTPLERAIICIKRLGRVEKNEVITPESIVNKMINKLPDNLDKDTTILEVNSKYGEFLIGIYLKYGKEIAKNMKVIPSSETTIPFINKIINILELDEYNIMDKNYIIDVDGNGKYDVRDFLDLENSEIIDMNNKKKFDICIQNPPYGSVGGDTLHLQFVDKCLDIADKQIVVMPYTFVSKVNNKPAQKYKEKFSKYLISVDEELGGLFNGTHMPNVGIYNFDKNKQNNIIKITPINGESYNVKSLLDITEFNDYEKEIVKYLKNNGSQFGISCGGHDHVTKQSLNKKGIFDNKLIEKLIDQNIIDNCKNIPENKIYLLVNSANGGMNGIFMSSKAGIIFKSKQDVINLLVDRKTTTFSNLLIFNSIKEAENCKIALQHPLLRFTCLRTQNDQMMTIKRVYKYVPSIDWEDDRVKTDEGLLEICGCPKDKCKEYTNYCKKIIDEVDNKK